MTPTINVITIYLIGVIIAFFLIRLYNITFTNDKISYLTCLLSYISIVACLMATFSNIINGDNDEDFFTDI